MWLRCCFMLMSILALFSTTCFAGIGFQPIVPEELKMTGEPKAPGAPAIILYRQVDRDDSGAAHSDEYFRIKILTEEGRKYADIEIPFYKEDGINVVNINARTIRPDGSVANYNGEIFENVSTA